MDEKISFVPGIDDEEIGTVRERLGKKQEWWLSIWQNTEKDYFLLERRLSTQVIEYYKLGVYTDARGRRIAFLPFWDENGNLIYWQERFLDESQQKYNNPRGLPKRIFNEHYFKTLDEGETIFICEGVFDALSFESLGYKAIALCGVDIERLKKLIESTRADEKYILITAFDNDEAGRRAREQLPYQAFEIPREYKDANEFYVKDPHLFDVAVRHPDSLFMHAVVRGSQDIKPKPTGFKNLDALFGGGLKIGLYVLGGIPAVGKTTFLFQIAENLARQGLHALYFSMEQSKDEFWRKYVKRHMWLMKDAGDKRIGEISDTKIEQEDFTESEEEIYEEIVSEFKEKIHHRLNVIECNYASTVDYIRAYTARYMSLNKITGKDVVIFVDFLQVVPVEKKDVSTRERIENVVVELRRLSKDMLTTVFVASSFNRDAYFEEVSLKSFKETGGIEYTADVLLALTLDSVGDDKKIQAEMASDKRNVRLVCLKNRTGRGYFTIAMTYYPDKERFEEKTINESQKGKELR
ncbi:MAG: DnaB-like helicase C-terminal domain-containing protein [Archaeoglobaceae archaeon]